MKIKYFFPLLLVLFTFACKNELTIFEQINQETKLEKPDITGSVNSIVQFKDKLYASDGNLYSKDVNAVRGWGGTSKPSGSIDKLAADQNNLYALNGNKELFTTTDGTSWTKIDISETISSIETIFCNGKDRAYIYGTGKTDNKKAYFPLNGITPPSNPEDTITSTVVLKTDNGTYTASKDGADGVVEGPDNSKVEGLGTIFSLTYSATDNAIYAGTVSGLKKLPVDDAGKLTGENHNPPGNYDATIKDYHAFAVIATGNTADDSALYSSTIKDESAYAKINGLWGYYYTRRNNWNRE